MVRARAMARIEQAAQRRCLTIAAEIVAEIAGNPHTPYDPEPDGGVHLRDSYSAVATATGARIRTSAPYWHYVEFGTGHGEAQPHIRPAVEAVRAAHR